MSLPVSTNGRPQGDSSPDQRRRHIIVSATIPDANPLPLDLDLYREDGTGEPEPDGDLPQYTILTTSRGCPFKCAYCAANVLNEGRKVWVLWPKRAAGTASDLSMPAIREMALGVGLVDYKVCAVDEKWSGMALGKRR